MTIITVYSAARTQRRDDLRCICNKDFEF